MAVAMEVTPSQIRDEAVVAQAHSLADLGIYPIASWNLVARCPWHGRQTLLVADTTELLDGADVFIRCESCAGRAIQRWMPVEAATRA